MSCSARPLACGLSQSGEELDFFSCCCYGVTPGAPGASNSCSIIFCSGLRLVSWRIFLSVPVQPWFQAFLVLLHLREGFSSCFVPPELDESRILEDLFS